MLDFGLRKMCTNEAITQPSRQAATGLPLRQAVARFEDLPLGLRSFPVELAQSVAVEDWNRLGCVNDLFVNQELCAFK